MFGVLQKTLRVLQRLPLRVTAIPGALILGFLIWAATKAFPSVDRERVELIGAFAIALVFAFSIGRRRT